LQVEVTANTNLTQTHTHSAPYKQGRPTQPLRPFCEYCELGIGHPIYPNNYEPDAYEREASRQRNSYQHHGFDYEQLRLARKTYTLGCWNIGVLVVTMALVGIYACYAARQANANKTAAGTAAKQLALSERPWLSVDFEILQPLSFDDKGASLGVKWHLTNIGHSIASKVTVRDTLVAVNLSGNWKDNLYSPPIAEESRMCQPTPWLTQMSSIITGFRLFPDEDVSQMDTARVSQADITKATTWRDDPHPNGPIDGVGIMLVGCITYESVFGHHHTGFLRVLGTAQPDASTSILVKPSGKHPDLTLEQIPIGNSAD
jgi:hypothetical protein